MSSKHLSGEIAANDPRCETCGGSDDVSIDDFGDAECRRCRARWQLAQAQLADTTRRVREALEHGAQNGLDDQWLQWAVDDAVAVLA
jgi:hypothetical protein